MALTSSCDCGLSRSVRFTHARADGRDVGFGSVEVSSNALFACLSSSSFPMTSK